MAGAPTCAVGGNQGERYARPLFETSIALARYPQSVVMLVFMFILIFILMLVAGIVVVVVIGHIVADSPPCCAAHSSTDQATGGTTDTVADYLTTRCTKPCANS